MELYAYVPATSADLSVLVSVHLSSDLPIYVYVFVYLTLKPKDALPFHPIPSTLNPTTLIRFACIRNPSSQALNHLSTDTLKSLPWVLRPYRNSLEYGHYFGPHISTL